jgi:DNA-directed RNA polymerase specialized sigma24 family protein
VRGTHRFAAARADVGASDEPMDATSDLDMERCARANGALHPYNDADSAEVFEEAVSALVLLRAPMWLGDAAVTTSVLVTLAREAKDRLRDAVVAARDQDYSWEEIARSLGTSVSTARRRYGDHGQDRWA